jgi:uncharacterized membrane protein
MIVFIQRIIHDLITENPQTLFVHFPIALCSAGLFFVLLALWRKNDTLETVAFANISLAAVSTIVTGAMGIRDNAAFYAGQAPNHVAKIILASILFVITSVTALVRWRKPNLFHSRGKWLYVAAYFVCFGLVAVLGFLGSIIIYGF